MPLYFAYGSNLSVAQMQRRCSSAEVVSSGRLCGFRLAFTFYSTGWEGGVADVTHSEDGEVWGLVFDLTEADLQRLDRFEGVPTHYERFQADIEVTDKTLHNVWVYAVSAKQQFIRPTSAYLDTIKAAARKWKFPQAYCEMLELVETQDTRQTG